MPFIRPKDFWVIMAKRIRGEQSRPSEKGRVRNVNVTCLLKPKDLLLSLIQGPSERGKLGRRPLA